MEALFGIGSAFGLSTSAGLNAYIPMLMVSIMGRMGWLDLGEPYNIMESWWVIGILSVLLLVEVFEDKIPAVDSERRHSNLSASGRRGPDVRLSG